MTDRKPHVPAWRKLGLKLKYAKESSEESIVPASSRQSQQPTAVNGLHSTNKRKLLLSEPSSTHQDIQPRKGKGHNKFAQPFMNDTKLGESNSSNGFPVRKEEPFHSETTKRRKSVTFTSDTKLEDGTSAKELFDSWRQDEKMNREHFDQPAFQVFEQSQDTGERKCKRPKRSKSTLLKDEKIATSNLSSSEVRANGQNLSISSPVLQYLDSFHRYRPSWKFSKARQNQLFKQIFDFEKIPRAYDDALLAYLGGLQSQASRNQLHERALLIREQDVSDGVEDANMDGKHEDKRNHTDRVSTDEERHAAAYRDALRKHKAAAKWDAVLDEEEELQMSEEWERRLAKRMRAEKMLQKLGELKETVNTERRSNIGIDYEVERVVERTMNQKGNITLEKRKRKRKRRTAMPLDDSTSEESSSDSDNDSDDNEIMAKKLKKVDSFVSGNETDGEKTPSETSSSNSSNAGTNSDTSENDSSDSESSGRSDTSSSNDSD